MSRNQKVVFVNDELLKQAVEDLKKLDKGDVMKRLTSIIAVGKGKKIDDIASILMTTRQSIYSWVYKYKKNGLVGLLNNPKGHRQSLLNAEQKEEIEKWLFQRTDTNGNPVNWTVDKLKQEIWDRFEITIGRTRTWHLIKTLGYRLIVPRKKHIGSDPEAQEAFKKKIKPNQ